MATLQNNPLPELNQNQTAVPIPSKKQKKGTNKLLVALLFILTAIIFSITGALVYYLVDDSLKNNDGYNSEKEQQDSDEDDTQEESNEEQDNNDEESTDLYEGWKTLDTGVVTLKYPPYWEPTLTEKSVLINFVHTDDENLSSIDYYSPNEAKMTFSLIYYNEISSYVCRMGSSSTITINTKSNSYEAVTYPAIMGLYGNGEGETGNDSCDAASSESVNSTHIKITELSEFAKDIGFGYLSTPELAFTYNNQSYPDGEKDFKLMMETLEVK